MRRTTLISALIVALAITAVVAPAATAKSGGGTTRSIALRGSVSFPGATGKAVSKVNGSERELEIDAQHLKALAGKHVNVNVNGRRLGVAAREHTRPRQRQPQHRGRPARPAHHKGLDRVRVRTLGGTLILSGTF